VGADIGYAIPINRAFLKPYGMLGFVSYSQDIISDSGTYEDKDNSVFAGIGLRFQYSHFYADINLDYYILEEDDFDSSFTQTAVTAGYKF
jgi:hypothetical protein